MSSEIVVTCENYTGFHKGLNGSRRRNVSRLAFLRAALTVGMQKTSGYNTFGWREFLHRFGIGLSAFSFLERRRSGLCVARAYSGLDMSEKGAASYWYGMIFAKLAGESELSIPWLYGVDWLRSIGLLATTAGTKERGDLAGLSPDGYWHVIEAKGRSNSYPSALIVKAKKQAGCVKTISRHPPATTSACITSLNSNPISVLLDDPNEPAEGTAWTIDEVAFIHEYYRAIRACISQSPYARETTDGRGGAVKPCDPVPVRARDYD